jgi:multisubunit Na+/H+ antiporter MnhG subunit
MMFGFTHIQLIAPVPRAALAMAAAHQGVRDDCQRLARSDHRQSFVQAQIPLLVIYTRRNVG